MPNFIFAYHGGHTPEGEEEVAKTMAAWQAWFEEMGSAVVDPGNPVGASKTVTRESVQEDGGANPISGYTVISADDIDAAARMAKGCPMVADGTGSIEVAEIHQM
ncbi:MAG: YciI family protein [Pseudomonadota bacterium]